MIKKIVIFLGIVIILFLSLSFYYNKKYETVECWWGVMYPSLSVVGFEDESQVQARLSSLNPDYLYFIETKHINEPVKYKIAIIEWLNRIFSF